MIVTRSWLEEWIDLSGISTDEIAKTFNSIGLEVDRLHHYDIPKKIVFGKVLECEKHPDADKLNVCQVDIGSSIRQIVCGASNVRAGLDVVVATIGAVMPDGMVIKPVKLRGVESEGMICSASEIGLPSIGSGIVELDESAGKYKLGQEVCTSALFSDDLIEIELTANRGDCLSIRGVARDLSAAYNRKIKEYAESKGDDKRGIGRILSLSHEKDLDANLRYKALECKDLKIPFVVKLRLAQIEESREDDIDSLLLYITHSTGVILRAYRHDFFAHSNTKIAKVLLAEDENGYACIKSEDGKVASIIGIRQEDQSRVNHQEGIVLLEASYIPPDIISKAMSLKKIEAGPMFYKTSRGSEPELNGGLNYCINLIESCSSSSTFSGTIELSKNFKEKIVFVSKQDIDDIIGAQIDKIKVAQILKNLGFDISKSSQDNFVITVPQFRHDIQNKQDIVEEIVRMVGIDNIPAKPFVFAEANRLNSSYFEYKKRVFYRHRSAQSGFFESVHFIFDEKKVLNSYGFETTQSELELLNPIASTLDTIRPTLYTGLLNAASLNIKNGYSSIKLFELGSVFSPSREESLRLTFLFSGDVESDKITNVGRSATVDFGTFVQKISDIVGDVELEEFETSHKLSHPYQCAKVIQNNEMIGELFRVHPEVEKSYDLEATYLCELDFDKLTYELKTAKVRSKFQASFRDLSLLVPNSINYNEIKDAIKSINIEELVRFYPVDKYWDETIGDNTSLSLRFVLQSKEKTLQEEDINSATDKILALLKEKFGIGLR